MFKYTLFVIIAVIACAAGKPHLIGTPLAFSAPAVLVAAPSPVVTATSSQFIARNYNGIATAPVAAFSAPAAHLTYSVPFTYHTAPVLW